MSHLHFPVGAPPRTVIKPRLTTTKQSCQLFLRLLLRDLFIVPPFPIVTRRRLLSAERCTLLLCDVNTFVIVAAETDEDSGMKRPFRIVFELCSKSWCTLHANQEPEAVFVSLNSCPPTLTHFPDGCSSSNLFITYTQLLSAAYVSCVHRIADDSHVE